MIHAIIKLWDHMNEARVQHRQRVLGALVLLALLDMSLGVTGCQSRKIPDNETPSIEPAASTPTLLLEPQDARTEPSNIQATSDQPDGFQPVWGTYEPPGIDPATPIPPPLTGLDLSDEVMVWVLLYSSSHFFMESIADCL